MPGKHNAGGCGCCGNSCWDCELVDYITVEDSGFSPPALEERSEDWIAGLTLNLYPDASCGCGAANGTFAGAETCTGSWQTAVTASVTPGVTTDPADYGCASSNICNLTTGNAVVTEPVAGIYPNRNYLQICRDYITCIDGGTGTYRAILALRGSSFSWIYGKTFGGNNYFEATVGKVYHQWIRTTPLAPNECEWVLETLSITDVFRREWATCETVDGSTITHLSRTKGFQAGSVWAQLNSLNTNPNTFYWGLHTKNATPTDEVDALEVPICAPESIKIYLL